MLDTEGNNSGQCWETETPQGTIPGGKGSQCHGPHSRQPSPPQMPGRPLRVLGPTGSTGSPGHSPPQLHCWCELVGSSSQHLCCGTWGLCSYPSHHHHLHTYSFPQAQYFSSHFSCHTVLLSLLNTLVLTKPNRSGAGCRDVWIPRTSHLFLSFAVDFHTLTHPPCITVPLTLPTHSRPQHAQCRPWVVSPGWTCRPDPEVAWAPLTTSEENRDLWNRVITLTRNPKWARVTILVPIISPMKGA